MMQVGDRAHCDAVTFENEPLIARLLDQHALELVDENSDLGHIEEPRSEDEPVGLVLGLHRRRLPMH